MEKVEFNEWLKDEDNMDYNTNSYDLKKRIDFLTEQVHMNQQSQIDAYNTMKIIMQRQNDLANALNKLTTMITEKMK